MPIKIVPKTEEEKKTYDEARSKFLKGYDARAQLTEVHGTPKKYLDYADQEGKEAVENVEAEGEIKRVAPWI
jgi:hypothetical protein